jgi:hypothetical protein
LQRGAVLCSTTRKAARQGTVHLTDTSLISSSISLQGMNKLACFNSH